MARILVLDDVPEIVAGLHRILVPAGHDVVAASTAKDALNILSKRPADLVIMDIFMPDRDGLELITDLRDGYPGVKILAISGGSQRFPPGQFLTVARHFGADSTLMKPFTPAALLEAVSALLSS
jgi:CheY-like chemotaxis protein